MSNKISVVIEKDEFGYYAYCPELVGCQTQGDSLDNALANIKEAVEAYLSTLSDEEKREIISKEILTTSIEVAIA
ncbi:MAG TPA: type II toxin-antitoxin system HicB family antitoxin [Spirochaetota bacterium]|mgnify:CR=1 FL=1|nr:type II toxin-antitoxin system HicB family antitoxin [Spirochaetota bacterium]